MGLVHACSWAIATCSMHHNAGIRRLSSSQIRQYACMHAYHSFCSSIDKDPVAQPLVGVARLESCRLGPAQQHTNIRVMDHFEVTDVREISNSCWEGRIKGIKCLARVLPGPTHILCSGELWVSKLCTLWATEFCAPSRTTPSALDITRDSRWLT